LLVLITDPPSLHLRRFTACSVENDNPVSDLNIFLDGRELARYYLSKRNLTGLVAEVDKIKTEEDLEKFLLDHGENIVDCLGEQVDRIERELKELHPEIRYVDLEVL
jgi:zinc transporter 9